ncbi:hypothetical protein CEB3_c34840 [Peptococcaceae bacterium CEB3]|nr:hypothetical protein CEB3_c34840 [Peptococcaceae bacterium CEB3]
MNKLDALYEVEYFSVLEDFVWSGGMPLNRTDFADIVERFAKYSTENAVQKISYDARRILGDNAT